MEEKFLALQELAGALRDLLADLVNLVQLAKLPDAADDRFDDGDEAGQNIDPRELLDKFAKLVWVIRQKNHDARLFLIKLTVELFHGNVGLHEREFASYCDYVVGLVETVSQHASRFCPIRIEDLKIEEWSTDFANWVKESSNELARSPKRYADWLYCCCEQELRAAEHKLRYPATPIKLEFAPYFPTEFDELLNGRSFAEAIRDTSAELSTDDVMSPRKPTTRVYAVKEFATQLGNRSFRIKKGQSDYGNFFDDPIASECLAGIKQLVFRSDKEDQTLYELAPWRFVQEKLLNVIKENYFDWPLSRLAELIQSKLIHPQTITQTADGVLGKLAEGHQEEIAAISRTAIATTQDEAETLLIGLAEQDPSVKLLSLDKSIALLERTNGKKCTKHTLRVVKNRLGWHASKKFASKTQRLRTVSLENAASIQGRTKSIDNESVTEEEAVRKIRSLSIDDSARDKILMELREERTTPLVALNTARQIEEGQRARTT